MIKVDGENVPATFPVGVDTPIRIRIANEGTSPCLRVRARLVPPTGVLIRSGKREFEYRVLRPGKTEYSQVILRPRKPIRSALRVEDVSWQGRGGRMHSSPAIEIPILARFEEAADQRSRTDANPSVEPAARKRRGMASTWVFVSYCHRDKRRVQSMHNLFHREGIPMWYDEGLQGGERWSRVLAQRIRECTALVLFATEEAVHRDFIEKEIVFATKHSRPIIVVVPDLGVRIPDWLDLMLGNVQFVQRTREKAKNEFWRSVVQAVKSTMNGRVSR